MSRNGKIGLSLFAVAALMLVIGIAASGTFNGAVSANNPAGPVANGPAGAAPAPYVSEGIWAQKAPEKILPNGARVVQDTKHDTSPPLRDIRPAAPQTKGEGEANENDNPFLIPEGNVKDTVVQRSFGPLVMPTPILVFEGIGFPQSTCNCAPPDTNGDVGPNHYIQIVNTAFQIFDKNGTSLQSPRAINTLFAGFGGPCEVRNNGDPIVLYDSIADRWFINQFTSSAPYYQCTAISTTPDPLGTYHRYGFQTSVTDFYDYQKYGVWPDAYYMTANVFEGDGGFRPSAAAFDRARMLQGLSATYQEFNPGPFYGNILPSDLDGTVLPPAGEPNFFASQSGTNDRIRLWKFHVDFATPGNSTFTGPTSILVAPYDSNLCGSGTQCVPQLGTSQRLSTVYDRPMFRLAYRNMGSYENLLLNHSVDENSLDHAAVRWYELRDPNGAVTVYQQGTYAPDALHRWMGSMAMDRDGNIAVGYSASSSTEFPSIRYAGRLATDPLGTLGQGEAVMHLGTGSQTGTNGRWGDYSDMVIDPTDDCTFWYTTEYYQTTGAFNWRTKIGKFKFPSCGGPPAPTATPGGPTATATALPTNTALPTATACANYTFTQSTDTMVPGITDTGVHCDDCAVFVTPPFPIRLYERTFTSASLSSNGVVEFASADFAYGNACLPVPIYEYTVLAYWDDLLTTAAGDGIFTSVSGVAPNRIWNVDFRTQVLNNANLPADFEMRFYENSNQVDLIYGTVSPGTSDYTIGVQRDGTVWTQIACSAAPIAPGTKYTLNQPCGLITATPVVSTPTTAATNTVAATNTPGTPGATATVPAGCTIMFSDVPPGSTFYDFVRCLACRGIISGYDDGTFRPNNSILRGQIAKMVSNAAGFSEDPNPQIYTDVDPSNPFYQWINRLSRRGDMSGYPCGGQFEPCDAQNRPYFRPFANATRGQLAKIVANAADIVTLVPAGTQTYTDVPPSNPFYLWIEQLTALFVMSGYPCGGPFEACDGQNRPYFRPFAQVTRGQSAKIVANTFFPGCQTPSRR